MVKYLALLRPIAHFCGWCYVAAVLAGGLGLVDFEICLGKPGTCAKVAGRTLT